MSVHDFINDPEGLHHYTGMESYDKFMLLLYCLGPNVVDMKYYHGRKPSLPIEDQLFVALMKLRKSVGIYDIKKYFKIDAKMITNIFVTWINALDQIFIEMIESPDWDVVGFFMSGDFKAKFSNTRMILDGTECPIN